MLLVHCCSGPVCQSQAVSLLKPEWKRGSYRFKHFPLGFISSLTRRSPPGLIGLPGNLLLHRWLGRMTGQHGTKCTHTNSQVTVSWEGFVMFSDPKVCCLVTFLKHKTIIALWRFKFNCNESKKTQINMQKVTSTPVCFGLGVSPRNYLDDWSNQRH